MSPPPIAAAAIGTAVAGARPSEAEEAEAEPEPEAAPAELLESESDPPVGLAARLLVMLSRAFVACPVTLVSFSDRLCAASPSEGVKSV